MPKVMEIIEKETKGKSYHTYKYSYDSIGLPSIDYDDDPNKVMKWKDSGETDSPKGAVDLKHLADQLQQLGETPLLKYFLDGSRHVFKVDDIAYNKQVFPVVAGQIGVGCCRRENKRMQKERFYRELVLALPDKANADGWDDAAYFAANVHYYYPYSLPKTRHWNTYMTPEEVADNIKKKKAKKYKYIYKYDKDNLDLMFANIDDSTQTMESIISYIMSGQGKFNQIRDWQEFLEAVKEKCSAETSGKDKEIPVASWRKFYRIINKSITDNKIFARDIREDDGETRIGDALKYIKKNEVHVIDIAKLSEDKQAYVFGDAVRTIYDLQLGQYAGEEGVNPPSRVVIFIDELNKYASKETPKNSPILRQVLDVAERGRSLGVILFAAEQFRSAIHDRVTGNCSTHAYGRTNSIEVAKGDYKSIPSVYKTMMTRLKQGEYIIQNPVFRSLLNIKFPKPIYKQFK